MYSFICFLRLVPVSTLLRSSASESERALTAASAFAWHNQSQAAPRSDASNHKQRPAQPHPPHPAVGAAAALSIASNFHQPLEKLPRPRTDGAARWRPRCTLSGLRPAERWPAASAWPWRCSVHITPVGPRPADACPRELPVAFRPFFLRLFFLARLPSTHAFESSTAFIKPPPRARPGVASSRRGHANAHASYPRRPCAGRVPLPQDLQARLRLGWRVIQ